MSLKSYEGGWKVAVIWMAEKLNQAATNKLLKIVEEPPEKTLFLFVCESEETLLETLVSRCQIFRLRPLNKNKIEDYLIKKGVKTSVAKKAAINCTGNLRTALKSVYEIKNEKEFEEWFLKWVRTAFKVKSNKEEVLALVEWSKTMSKEGREIQKSFLTFSLNIFRNALMKNYGVDSLVTFEPKTDLNFESFSKYVHGNNIEEISQELESAITGIQSNGNPNFIFMDLSLKLTRLIQ
jgi:DNA polymerase-3 subunit delta'